jgi:hypothetical protein
MNVYQKVLNDLHLDANNQGEGQQYSLLYILLDKLAELETANPIGDVHTNAVSELLTVRLNKYADTPAVKEFIAPLLVPRAPRFGAA